MDRNTFYTYETCNRGPLLLDRQKVKELGYLDAEHFFQDNSEHDLMARAYLTKGYICGYVPLDFSSPLAQGSTRKKRDAKNETKLAELGGGTLGGGHLETHRPHWKDVPARQYQLH